MNSIHDINRCINMKGVFNARRSQNHFNAKYNDIDTTCIFIGNNTQCPTRENILTFFSIVI